MTTFTFEDLSLRVCECVCVPAVVVYIQDKSVGLLMDSRDNILEGQNCP